MAEQVIVCMRSLPQGKAREVSALGHRLAGALWGCCWTAPSSSFLRVGCAWQRRRVVDQCGRGRTALSRSAIPGRQRWQRSAGCESASISSLPVGRICGWRAECLPRMNSDGFLSGCRRAHRTLLRGCGHCGRPMPNGLAWGLRALPGATNLSGRWNLQSMRREKSGAATAFARRDVCGWGSICSLSCCRRRWARS